jgi:uncharacterized protein (TIGR02186 family)
MRARGFLALLAILAGMPVHPAAFADDLVTHLDVDQVDVTTRFEGQSILLFGAVPRGTDVVIKVVSPEQEVELGRKSQVGPLWLESGQATVRRTPGLLYLLSSRPLSDLLGNTERQALGLTLTSVLKAAEISGDSIPLSEWQVALLRLKRRRGFYVEDGHGVKLEGGRLFYTHIDLPPESPLGLYQVSVYLLRDGKVVQRQQRTLVVQEVRLQHWISRVAHDYGWTFGAFFTLGMMLLGLVLGMALRPSRNA